MDESRTEPPIDGMPLGATELDPDEAADLIPDGIRTLTQLNAFEQANIVAASEWILRPRNRPRPERILTTQLLLTLHRRMFGDTWRWAGSPRRTDKNIGVHWPRIRVSLQDRVDDARLWYAQQVFPPDELAVRFHHALVLVHPFPNGNGRWSRLAADALLHSQRLAPFSWGRGDLLHHGQARTAYLTALKLADRGDMTALLTFARS